MLNATKNIFVIVLITFINFQFILTKDYCGSLTPRDSSSCTLYSNENSYCCYLESYYNSFYSNMCYSIKKTEYYGLNNKLKLGEVEYSMDCGIEIGLNCGLIRNPVDYKDCSQFSLNTNQCCFIEYNGDRKCVWLGTGDTGMLQYKGLTIKCDGISMKFNFFVFLLFFMLF